MSCRHQQRVAFPSQMITMWIMAVLQCYIIFEPIIIVWAALTLYRQRNASWSLLWPHALVLYR